MVDFSKLKRNGADSLSKIAEQVKKITTPENNSSDDTRFWYPNVDKAGNGYAVIRFLPAPGEEEVPFVRMFSHGFKHASTGLWYIENSLTTIGKNDPVSEYNSQLWNSTSDDDSPARKQARNQKRKLNYISNIYVVSDPANPENDGQIRLFRYGKKIFDKLNEAMNPQFADETPMNPFDLWTGANFKIKIRNVAGYRNYDASEFDAVSPLSKDDKSLEQIWKKEHLLQPLIAPDQFKDYDVLKARLNTVLGLTGSGRSAAIEKEDMVERQPVAPRASKPKATSSEAPPWEETPAEDDDLSYFKRLAEA